MTEIKYPSEKTYFIGYNENDDNVHYGIINTDQCMVTGKENVYTTTVEQEYIDELLVHNIIYEDTLLKPPSLPEGITGTTHSLTI
jgi:hypothetical protein